MGVGPDPRVDEDGAHADRLNRWLKDEVGAEEPRRVVSRSDTRVLVSKFAGGFAERLRDSLDRRLTSIAPFANLADHYWIEFERTPS